MTNMPFDKYKTKDTKKWFLFTSVVVIISVACLLGTKACGAVALIERYIDFYKLVILLVLGEAVYSAFLFLFLHKVTFSWEKKVFYGVMLSAIACMLFLGYITHGESIRSFLVNDKNDGLMDFFNSVQYGKKPYENLVIYPPLINVIYGFLGRYMFITMDGFAVRVSQMGILVYGIYAITVYSLLFHVIYKIKAGNKNEKLLFISTLVLSVPFLFAYDRGNSIILVLIALLMYVKFYDSHNIWRQIGAYSALGIAAGIKISPVICGFLLFNKHSWKSIIIAISIVCIWFFLPFVFTDGNIFILIDNIRNTDNIKDVINMNSMAVNVGSGVFVNTSAFLDSIGRYFDINTFTFSSLLNYALFFWGISLVSIGKNIEEWKKWTVLVGMMVLLPGFSAVYNLILFVIPLILFLNSNPVKCVKNFVYTILYIGIFIPLVNYPLEALNIFITDWHPASITTFIESLCALVLVFAVVVDCIKKVCISNRRFVFCAMGLFVACGVFLGAKVFTSTSVESFYCANMKAENAISGFIRKNGQYLGIQDEEATVNLKTEKLLQYGLVVSFGRWDDIRCNIDEDVALYVDGEYLGGINVHGMSNQYIFIPAHDLQKYQQEDMVKVTLVRQKINADYVPVLYVGPAKASKQITDADMIAYSTMGLCHDNGSLRAEKLISFLCDYDKLCDGVLAEYYAPAEYVNSNVSLKINGVEVNSDYVYKCGTNLLYISADMLPVEMQDIFADDGIVNVEIEFSDADARAKNKILEKYISVSYIGMVPELSSWRDMPLSDGNSRVILPVNQIENGLDIALGLSNLHNYQDTRIQVFQEKRLLGSHVIYEDSNFQGIHIPSEVLDLNGTLLDLSFKIVSDNNLNGNFITITSIETDTMKKALSGIEEDLDAKYFNQGLTFDKQSKLWYMGDKATFCILPSVDSNTLKLKYDVSEYLLMNSDVCIDVYVNGEKMYSELPHNIGENGVDILLPEYVIAKNNGCVQVMLIANKTYNFKKLHISRLKEMSGDRSIGIKYVGF